MEIILKRGYPHDFSQCTFTGEADIGFIVLGKSFEEGKGFPVPDISKGPCGKKPAARVIAV